MRVALAVSDGDAEEDGETDKEAVVDGERLELSLADHVVREGVALGLV